MAQMILDSYTFTKNPSEMTLINVDKDAHVSLTIGGMQWFNWGTRIAGKQIQLKWDYMITSQFNQLETIYEKDNSVVFDPQTDAGVTTYNVYVKKLEGAYFLNQADNADMRKNVNLTLYIESQV